MKGILFKPEVWKAKQQMLDQYGETQTRRVIKQLSPEYEWEMIDAGEPILMFKDGIGGCIFLKPRYQAGETVYIKETWCPLIPPVYNLLDPTIPTVYKQEMDAGGAILPKEFKWRSPTMMPEWAARHFITITGVRAERLQEINRDGVLAEGVSWQDYKIDYQWAFSRLWNSINPKYPWESNPFILTYIFRRQND